jgi:hypothetical protein
MASGFLLQEVGGANHSFGTNHSVGKGWHENHGRYTGFRYDSSGAFDRFSIRVGRCNLVTNQFPYTMAAGASASRSFMTSGAAYNTATYCPRDTFTISNFSTYANEFISIDNTNGRINLSPHVNKTRLIRSYTFRLNHATSYSYGGANPTFSVTVNTGSICNTKMWRTPTYSMPTSQLTGVDHREAVDRTLEHDLDGTSWTGVCSYTATLSLISPPSFITIYGGN